MDYDGRAIAFSQGQTPRLFHPGAACNIKRWLRHTAWQLQNGLTAALSTATAN